MTEILFYHLERATLDSVLPGLLEKSLERGWKAVVRVGAKDRIAALDERLWTYRDDSFLPHASGGDGSRQPIWITADDDAPNAAEIIFLVEGAVIDPGAASRFIRCVAIFDGRDEEALAAARAFWKEARLAGHDATYWKQSETGRWEKQA